MSEKTHGKSFVTLRAFKKIGIVGAAVTATALLLIGVFAFIFPSTGDSLTIRIDDAIETPHLRLATHHDKSDEGTYFSGTPISRTTCTDTQSVYKYVTSYKKLDELSGSQNFRPKDTSGNPASYEAAIVYTIYLISDSDKDESYNYTYNLDGFGQPTNNTTNPLDYLRVITFISDVTASLDSEVNLKTNVYGSLNAHNIPTIEAGYDSYNEETNMFDDNDALRECISTYKKDVDLEGRTVRKPTYTLPSGQGYCEPFVSVNEGEQLVRGSVMVPANGIVRFTLSVYFEGFDPDSYPTEAPVGAYIATSLHFGK